MKEVKFYKNWEEIVHFGADGPAPRKLVDTPDFKSVIVGLEKGQAIPPHAAHVATFHILQGTGRLTAGGEEFDVGPGATAVIPNGVLRGIEADTRLVFLVSHGPAPIAARKPAMNAPLAVMVGMLVMMGIMAGVMFGPALLMSRLGMPAVGMRGLMYLPLVGMALMAVAMFFFFRHVTGKGGGMHMMDSHSEHEAERPPAEDPKKAGK